MMTLMVCAEAGISTSLTWLSKALGRRNDGAHLDVDPANHLDTPESEILNLATSDVYTVYTEEKSFDDALATCQSMGGSLATPKSYAEQNKLIDYLKLKNVDDDDLFWIGSRTPAQSKERMWLTGEPIPNEASFRWYNVAEKGDYVNGYDGLLLGTRGFASHRSTYSNFGFIYVSQPYDAYYPETGSNSGESEENTPVSQPLTSEHLRHLLDNHPDDINVAMGQPGSASYFSHRYNLERKLKLALERELLYSTSQTRANGESTIGLKTTVSYATSATADAPTTQKAGQSERKSIPGSSEMKMNLALLPDVPLRLIASYLTIEERIRFSQLNPDWGHLQPTVQLVVREDFIIDGPSGGHFHPEIFFDIEVESPGLKSVYMKFRWSDQGCGNRKGQVWLRLMRNGEEIADARESYGAVAPQNGFELRELTVVDHDVVRKSRRGDVLRVMRNAGPRACDSRHRLLVKDFTMTLEHVKPVITCYSDD